MPVKGHPTSVSSMQHVVNQVIMFRDSNVPNVNLATFPECKAPDKHDLTLLYNICQFNNVEKSAKRLLYNNVRSFSRGLRPPSIILPPNNKFSPRGLLRLVDISTPSPIPQPQSRKKIAPKRHFNEYKYFSRKKNIFRLFENASCPLKHLYTHTNRTTL